MLSGNPKPCLPCAIAICILPLLGLGPSVAAAQQSHDEITLIRAELERIIREDASGADDARKALEALNQPENSPQGRQARNRRERGARRIVNGIPASGHPAIGALLKGNDPRTAKIQCTGTLVGCDKFLTAAHCIQDDPNHGSYVVFFQELGFFRVTRIDWNKLEYKFPYFDLAMLTLDRPAQGVAPVAMNKTTAVGTNRVATLVGFGRTGGARLDYGIKREGSARTQACPADYTNLKVLCWHFDADVKPDSSASNTCNADSGGGVIMTDSEAGRNIPKVFGVVSGGTDKNCLKKDLSYNVDVLQYRDWIETTGEGRLSNAMCGSALWQSSADAPRKELVQLGSASPEQAIKINIPAGIALMRVAMNGEDNGDGKNDFDLTVYTGERRPGARPACAENGSGQFAMCELKAPRAGPWTVSVTRKKGEGNAQITITLAR